MKKTKEKKKIERLKSYISKLETDIEDMISSHRTSFYRCECGHIKEDGIICPSIDCESDKRKNKIICLAKEKKNEHTNE